MREYDRPAAEPEGSDETLDRCYGGAGVRHFKRRVDPDKVVLHVDNKESRLFNPLRQRDIS